MTGTTTVTLDDDTRAPGRAPHGTWGLTWHGVRTVAVLDLRQRVRSTRWIVALVVWVVVVGAITLLTSGALSAFDEGGSRQSHGPLLFAAVTALVLGLGLLVTPTLSSTAVNGDRNAGTLATLQVTLLSPAEIAVGKLLAAWSTSCAFLVASIPFLGLALSMGGTPVVALLRVVLIVAALLAAVCGVGLGFSALIARTAGSTVLTFLTVAGLTVFTPILFGVTFPTITQTEQVRVYTVPNDWDGSSEATCEWRTEARDVSHTGRTWWLLAVNPFVVVADGAGTAEPADGGEGNDPLTALRYGVRELRAGPESTFQECWTSSIPTPDRPVSHAPVWPWGLGANLLLGAAGFVVAVRRLRIPQRTLARGTRIA